MKLGTYALSFEGKLEAITLSDQPLAGAPSGTDYRTVEGGQETMDGNVLMVEAYAALWVILFAFLFVSWRRQAKLDARIGELERALSSTHGRAK